MTNALVHGVADVRVRLIRRDGRVRFSMWNRVRSTPTRIELTLGLGLRVVKALVNQQPSLRFRQHHGSQIHGTSLTFPAAEERTRPAADAGLRSAALQ